MKAFYLVYIFILLIYGGVFLPLLPRFTGLLVLFLLFLPRLAAHIKVLTKKYHENMGSIVFFCDFLMLWIFLKWIIRFEFFLQQQMLIEQTLLVFVVIHWSNVFTLLNGRSAGTADSTDKFLYYLIWFTNLFVRIGVDTYLPERYQMYWHLNYEQFSRMFLVPIFAIALIRSVYVLLFSREEPA